jgi:hypothetical protein
MQAQYPDSELAIFLPVRDDQLAAISKPLARQTKQLRIFTVAQGSAEHVQADQSDQAKQLIADWFAQRFS